MKNFGFLKALLLLLVTQASFGQTPIFNGEDLSGWQVYGTEKWYVEDGLLVCESGPDAEYGYLASGVVEPRYPQRKSPSKLDDFELTLQFKQEANGNSGVFFRSTIEGTKISGWQVEVAQKRKELDDDATGGIYESYGRGWLIKPDMEKDANLKAGEWNTMKIRVIGPQVTTWLNGVEMVYISDEKIGAGEGSIALQIHSGGGIKVKWKDLRIEEL